MARRHAIGFSTRSLAPGHNHPHDPSDIVEWIVMFAAAALAITMVCALAFQIGSP
ncbi:MAG TPA: hypothetical protein VMU76_11255 [Acidimicrobiales bacterium]|nr:hypothetical protein [Acidimicrobiales bacterium]